MSYCCENYYYPTPCNNIDKISKINTDDINHRVYYDNMKKMCDHICYYNKCRSCNCSKS